jgi:hypothetical protein
MPTLARLAYTRAHSDISVATINAIGDLRYPTSSSPAAEHVEQDMKKVRTVGKSDEKSGGGKE